MIYTKLKDGIPYANNTYMSVGMVRVRWDRTLEIDVGNKHVLAVTCRCHGLVSRFVDLLDDHHLPLYYRFNWWLCKLYPSCNYKNDNGKVIITLSRRYGGRLSYMIVWREA